MKNQPRPVRAAATPESDTRRSASRRAAPSAEARRTAGGVATRERLLAAAERLFAERGFDGVSMPAIAAACGITAGAIYKHVESKEQLFFEVVRRAVEAAPATVSDEAKTGPGGLGASVAGFATRRRWRSSRGSVRRRPD